MSFVLLVRFITVLHVSVAYSSLLLSSTLPWFICLFCWLAFGLFPVWAIVNKATMNFLFKSFSRHVLSFVFGNRIAGMQHRSIFNFIRNKQFSEVVVLFTLPSAIYERFTSYFSQYTCKSERLLFTFECNFSSVTLIEYFWYC